MIKIVAPVRRRPGMTHLEFCEYIETVHGGLARANPTGLSRYVQNHIFDSAFGADGDDGYAIVTPRDSVTELYFKDVTALMETFASPYTREVIGPDGKNFADESTTLNMIVRDREIPVSAKGETQIKIMHFLAAGPREVPDFADAWASCHTVSQTAPLIESVGRCVLSLPVSGGPVDALAAYFGGKGGPSYCGIASYWLRGEADIPLFRDYQRKMEGAGKAQGVLDPSASFVVFAREITIVDFTGPA
jgi:hypothetical protein